MLKQRILLLVYPFTPFTFYFRWRFSSKELYIFYIRVLDLWFSLCLRYFLNGIYHFDCCSESRYLHWGFRAVIESRYVIEATLQRIWLIFTQFLSWTLQLAETTLNFLSRTIKTKNFCFFCLLSYFNENVISFNLFTDPFFWFFRFLCKNLYFFLNSYISFLNFDFLLWNAVCLE